MPQRPQEVFRHGSGNLAAVQVNSQCQHAGSGLFIVVRLAELPAGSGLTGRAICRTSVERHCAAEESGSVPKRG